MSSAVTFVFIIKDLNSTISAASFIGVTLLPTLLSKTFS